MYYRQMYCRLSFTCRIFSNSSLLLLEQRQGHPLGIHEVWLPGKASTGNWKYSEYHIICSSPTFPILAAKCVHQLVVQVTSFWLFSSCRYVGSTVPFSFSPRSLDTSNLLSCRPPATFRSIFAHLIEQEKQCFSWALALALGSSRQKQKEDHCVEEPRDIPIEHIWVIPLKFICDVRIVCQNI